MDDEREKKWLSGYERDGVELTREKLKRGFIAGRHAPHAEAWLEAQSLPARQSKKRLASWHTALKVVAAIASIIGAVVGIIAVWPS